MIIIELFMVICGDGTLDLLNKFTDIIVIDMASNQVINTEENKSSICIYTPEEQIQNSSYNDWEFTTFRPKPTYNL